VLEGERVRVTERESRRLPREEKKCLCDFTAAVVVVHDQQQQLPCASFLLFRRRPEPRERVRAPVCSLVRSCARLCACGRAELWCVYYVRVSYRLVTTVIVCVCESVVVVVAVVVVAAAAAAFAYTHTTITHTYAT